MKTKLISYSSLNLLYLPVIKINQLATSTKFHSSGSFIVAVDAETEGTTNNANTYAVGFNGGEPVTGVIFGATLQGDNFIRLDQGIDSSEVSPTQTLDPDLVEDSYIIQIDNRLGRIATKDGDAVPEDYIDDDNIAYYTVDLGDTFVSENTVDVASPREVIRGPRGTRLEMRIQSSMDLNTSSFLFEQLGGQTTLYNRTSGGSSTSNVFYIDSNVRVVGIKTGAMIDIPVRYVRLVG